MRNTRSEQGFALVAAVLVLVVISGLGLALLLLTNSGQKASAREQAGEAAFEIAEAALNAQVEQLSRAWPGQKTEALPVRCTESTTTESNGCPSAASLSASYPKASATCAANAPSEKWGSASTNEWTTYVRDDAEG